MKKLMHFLFISVLAFQTAYAQVPEKIYGKNKVMKPNEYYLEQIDLWKKELSKNSKNAEAWLNYYRANRNAYIKGEEDNSKKSKGNSRFDRLKNIVDEMEKQVPHSYEFHFAKWLNGNNNLELYPYLIKAHELSPESEEPILSLIFYHEIKGSYDLRDQFIEKYYSLGVYSPGLLNYSYNMLSGLDENAIVFTEGDKDTEAILLLQKGKKFRDDVRMLNLNLLLIAEYRDRIFKELEISPLDYDPMLNDENFEKFRQNIIQLVAANKKSRPVYAAVTVSDLFRKNINSDLYLTGLAWKYSDDAFDYLPVLKNNVENIFLLDYLKEYFPKDISIGNVISMNGNYLYPFAALSHYFSSTGEKDKAAYYKNMASQVAIPGGLEAQYKELFPEK